MSYLGDVAFSVYHGGYWVKLYNGEFTYFGGEMKSIESKPEEIFIRLSNEFSDGLSGQNLWYKMPFEDLKERKSFCIGDESFEKMCEAARWVKFVDLFLVNPSEHPDDIDGPEPCEAEVRVERSALNFVDEDENFDYHNTPPNSDGEEEDNVYRWKRGSGQLKLRQVFDTLEDFKEALVEYVLKEGRNIEFCRWGKDKSAAKCGIEKENCPWFIHCSYEEHVGKWMVKVFEDKHSCVKDGYCKMLKSPVITKLFLNDWRTDPEIKPKAIQNEILKNFNLIVSPNKIKKAKAKALEIIAKDHEEQFSRLKDYRLELLRSNHESTVLLDTFENDDGTETFHRFYVCFEVIKRLWKTWCRPIFGLDGCFLKSTLKGQLLAAVGRDANNGMYPIAWAVVDIENEPNWCWFIQNLKADLNLQNGRGFTLISDRQKGLLNAVERELPMVEHRMCARHIYANLKKAFPRQSEMKTLFWRVAESYTIPEYQKNLEAVQKYDMRIFKAIMEKNPKNCSLAFCGPTASCIDVHNNISESFNNAIDPARYTPMVEMLEVIRRSAMVRIDLRKLKARQHKSRFTNRATQFIELEQEKIKFCKMYPGSDGRCEVRECNTSFSLNMRMRTCSCRRWEMSGLPCRHALRVIADKKLNYEDYTSSWYSNSRQQQIYSDSIRPVTGMQFWQKLGCVVKPPAGLIEEVENRKGRKPKPKRKKGQNESPKKKVSREKRIMHCGRCGIAGHNAKNCKNFGVPKFLKPRKRMSSNTGEDGYESTNTNGGDTSDFGDGPSQSTQY